jgi:hypothetical protein
MREEPPAAPGVPERNAESMPGWSGRPSTVLGGALVLLGAILLLGQLARLDVGHYGWPLFIIAPGVLLLFFAVTARGPAGEGMAILGGIITVTGLILLYQNTTGHFETWAYGWALVFPGSIGAGMMLYGWVARRPANVRLGERLLGAALIVFFLGALFFEGVIGISGYQFDRSTGIILGAMIIGLGAVILIRNLTSTRRDAR